MRSSDLPLLAVIYCVIALCWFTVNAFDATDENNRRHVRRRSAINALLAPVWIPVLIWIVARALKRIFVLAIFDKE